MCLQDGYKLVRAEQLAAALAALNCRKITFRAFRVFIASLELVARREAAERSRTKKSPSIARYCRAELEQLIERGEGRPVLRELKALDAAGLLTFTERETCMPLHCLQADVYRALHSGRGVRRLVPVPRQLLKYLASSSRPAVAKTAVAYLLRGLSLGRAGELRNRGTVKVSWICSLCGVSERAARSARAELIRIGWITKDTGSVQRKLNRDGAYFVIDTAWRRAWKQSAPLSPTKARESAPPRERQETPSDLKYQKPAPRPRTGVLQTEGKPDLRNIRPEDITRLSRLRELFRQATEAGWIERSEPAFLNFVAAAARATRAAGDPVRIFVGIVRRRLWHHITQEQEERAAEVIRRARERTFPGSVIQAGASTITVSQLLRTMAA